MKTLTALLWGLFITLMLVFSKYSFAKEELVVIQTVSSSAQTFVIQRGRRDGVIIGQQSLFTNSKVSFIASAIEVSGKFSLWEIMEKKTVVPFEQGEIVTYNYNTDNILTEIPVLRAQLKAKQDAKNFKKYINEFQGDSYWQVRGGFSRGFSESTSEASSESSEERGGISASLSYVSMFKYNMDWGLTLRMDRENLVLSSPSLTIPTQRLYALAEFTYHFPTFKNNKNMHFYLNVGGGLGQSSTDINGETVTGTSYVFPGRFGLSIRYWENAYVLLEGVVESISSTEQFEDGSEQVTSITNLKFNVGLRF